MPSGILNDIPFPATIASGGVITSTKDVFESNETIKVNVRCTEAGSFVLALYKKDVRLDVKTHDLKAHQSHVSMKRRWTYANRYSSWIPMAFVEF